MNIYVFDIDGTISTGGKKVEPIISEKIIELSKNNQIFFASARPIRDMLPMLSQDLHTSIFIGCNGGIAWKNGEIILSHLFEKDFTLRILEIMKKLDIPYVIDGKWNYSFSKLPHPFHDYIRSLSNYETDENEIISSGVTKILILSETHKEKILSYIKDDNVSVHAHRGEQFYDLTPKGTNKHRTLFELIGQKKYVAFGNDQNDFIMLNNAQISVFIGTKENFSNATYYASIDEIPTLIENIETNKKIIIN